MSPYSLLMENECCQKNLKLPQGTHSDPQYRFHNVLFLCVATAWVLSAPYVCGCPVRPEEGVGVEGSCELWELNEP